MSLRVVEAVLQVLGPSPVKFGGMHVNRVSRPLDCQYMWLIVTIDA